MRTGILLATLLAANAHAANLAADSLVCEQVAELEFAGRQEHLKGEPASVVLKRAAYSVEGYRLQASSARLISMPRQFSAEQAAIDSQPYISLVSSCAAGSGSVAVLERKPISGLVRVRMTFQGRPAELWTFAGSVTE